MRELYIGLMSGTSIDSIDGVLVAMEAPTSAAPTSEAPTSEAPTSETPTSRIAPTSTETQGAAPSSAASDCAIDQAANCAIDQAANHEASYWQNLATSSEILASVALPWTSEEKALLNGLCQA